MYLYMNNNAVLTLSYTEQCDAERAEPALVVAVQFPHVHVCVLMYVRVCLSTIHLCTLTWLGNLVCKAWHRACGKINLLK